MPHVWERPARVMASPNPRSRRLAKLSGAGASSRFPRKPSMGWVLIPSTSRPFSVCTRSEEHTSELQSRLHLVCRLLLEKKKKTHHRQSDLMVIHHQHEIL